MPARRKLGPDLMPAVRAAWDAGEDAIDIGLRHGVSRGTVHYHMRGIPRRMPRRKGVPSRIDPATALALRERGEHIDNIAERYGVSRDAIYKATNKLKRARGRGHEADQSCLQPAVADGQPAQPRRGPQDG